MPSFVQVAERCWEGYYVNSVIWLNQNLLLTCYGWSGVLQRFIKDSNHWLIKFCAFICRTWIPLLLTNTEHISFQQMISFFLLQKRKELLEVNSRGWRDGSVVKTIYYSWRRPEASFQHQCGGSQPSGTPIPRLSDTSSTHHGHAYHVHAHM